MERERKGGRETSERLERERRDRESDGKERERD
jgi:hypothetical protein